MSNLSEAEKNFLRYCETNFPQPMTSQWTRIDPEIHNAEWFRGKGVTFLLKGSSVTSSYGTAHEIVKSLSDLWAFSHFLLHPPLPDPLEEEIEREAREHTSREQLWHGIPGYEEAIKAFIAGARAFLGKGK